MNMQDVVPKDHVEDDGGVGDFDGVALAGLNHKMGHRGTTIPAIGRWHTERRTFQLRNRLGTSISERAATPGERPVS
jgi:hypothetical protein